MRRDNQKIIRKQFDQLCDRTNICRGPTVSEDQHPFRWQQLDRCIDFRGVRLFWVYNSCDADSGNPRLLGSQAINDRNAEI